MIKKLKFTMMSLVMLAISSLALVACSDDDYNVMGPVAVNSCQYTATTVTPIWTLVPNDNCSGYIVCIYQGTRSQTEAGSASLVEKKEFDYRTCKYTFENLTPSTTYCITTQAVPSAKSGFSSAEIYYKEFTTAAQ